MVPGSECALELFSVAGSCKCETVLEFADAESGEFFELMMAAEEGLGVGVEFVSEELFKFEESNLEAMDEFFV